jgi:gas vesicle protein
MFISCKGEDFMKKRFLLGALVGGAAVFLTTTKKGKEIREKAKQEYVELKENYPEKVEKLKEKAKQEYETLKEKYPDKVEKAKEMIKSTLEKKEEKKPEEKRIILLEDKKEEDEK